MAPAEGCWIRKGGLEGAGHLELVAGVVPIWRVVVRAFWQ